LDFDATERLLALVMPTAYGTGKRMRLELPGGVSVERSARELRFGRSSANCFYEACTYELPVPGTVDAPEFGARFTASWPLELSAQTSAIQLPNAHVRAWRPGDRVELQHSRGPKKVKEILGRMRISAEDRTAWPVVTWEGNIIWMRGVILADVQNPDQPTATALGSSSPAPVISEIQL
jgi:tRNA(Ile)-lysidine synthetase-like protein